MDMKYFVQKCIYKTMCKRIEESKLKIRDLEVRKENVSYFSLSSNMIMSFEYEGKFYYFRECPQLLMNDEYVIQNINRIIDTMSQISIKKEHFSQEIPIKIHFPSETIQGFREYIFQLSQDISFLNKLLEAYKIAQITHFDIWNTQNYTRDFFEEFGLKNLPDNYQDIAIYFLWCMRNASFQYKTLHIASGEKYSHFLAVKAVASKIVAEALEMGHLITSAEYCQLKFEDGTTMFGVISLAAEGSRMIDSKVKIAGCLQKELLNMNILDLICFQTDHGLNNYNVKECDGYYRICAFDNDNPNTFFPFPMINYNFLGCSRIISSKGGLNRPYIDRNMVNKLMKIDIKTLRIELRPYLNKLQILALIVRIKRLKKMILRTITINPNCVISNDEWNESTVKEELSGKYGKTYLTIVAEQQREIKEGRRDGE